MKVIKYIAIAAAALAIAGCSKWTEQEPVEVLYPTLKDKNPELYAQYMESIREYRASEHQVLIAKFDNKQTAPAGRADHINCLPDSVDFVILRNPDNLSDAIVAEMKEIREEKGVKTLMEIDYNALTKTWEGILADEKDAKQAEYDAVDWESLSKEEADAKRQAFAEDPRGVDDTDRFIAWMGEQVKAILAVADKYGYDGLNAKFLKKDVQVCLEETAVAALRHDIVLLAKFQLRDNLGTRRALNGVVTPEFQFAVDALNVAVVAEYHGNPLLTSGIEKPCGCGNNSLTTVACERTGDEVVEHVDD